MWNSGIVGSWWFTLAMPLPFAAAWRILAASTAAYAYRLPAGLCRADMPRARELGGAVDAIYAAADGAHGQHCAPHALLSLIHI